MNSCLSLPRWRSVLAVVAHPDDESFGLGALLATYADLGARVSVLCFTDGGASTLHGVPGDLAEVRKGELVAAATVLGVTTVEQLDYPDGVLADTPVDELAAHVTRLADHARANGLLVFDPSGITGHPDHRHATAAALFAATERGLPVLGWTLPAAVADTLNREYQVGFVGHRAAHIDLSVTVDRTRQRAAALQHRSQALPTSVLWRRLRLLGDTEHLRWLHTPESPSHAFLAHSGRISGRIHGPR